MGRVVLDSSVAVKSVVRLGCWLPSSVYRRELETHCKARMVVRLLGGREYGVLLPCPVIVETGAVASRLADEKPAREIVGSLKSTRDYTIVSEEEIREDALEIAIWDREPGLRRLHNSPSLEEKRHTSHRRRGYEYTCIQDWSQSTIAKSIAGERIGENYLAPGQANHSKPVNPTHRDPGSQAPVYPGDYTGKARPMYSVDTGPPPWL